jgi:abhydrolase domain-containing protein 17
MELNGILFPAPPSSYSEDTFPGEVIWIPRVDAREAAPIPCLYLSCARGSSKVMLYFHGNAEDVGLAYELMDHLRSTLMVHVIAMEYPGYGIYPGESDAEQVQRDAASVVKYLVEELKMSSRNVLVFGRSIGSGPAAWLAANMNPGALLLMSAYTSIRSVVRSIAGSWAVYLVKERFNNLEMMPRVTCPSFFVHGQLDNLIPYEHSQRLHEACSGPCSLILPKEMDHNEFDFFDDLSLPFSAFLMQCGISVAPESMHTAFINFPPSIFSPPNVPKNENKGRWNKFFKLFS